MAPRKTNVTHSERFFPAQKHSLVHLGPWAEPPMSASEAITTQE